MFVICLFLYIAMVDVLTSKTMSWEAERGVQFTYDGVSSLSKSLAVLVLKIGIFYLSLLK